MDAQHAVQQPGQLYGLDARNRDQLIASAPLMLNWSRIVCAEKPRGGMEEWAKSTASNGNSEHTCGWYHGTWQYLRLLNMVAVPPWYDFYQPTLQAVLANSAQANILISAAADYGMLCTLHDAIVASGSSPTITLCDICATPLLASQWYAERHGISITCIRDDLLTSPRLLHESFDLIVTDELLTVLNDTDKPSIVDRWHGLLKPEGTVVTTAMIGAPTTPALRSGFASRARELLDLYSDYFDAAGLTRNQLIARFDEFADYHTRHMLADADILPPLFSRFDLQTTLIDTPGECVNPTSSLQIVATRHDG